MDCPFQLDSESVLQAHPHEPVVVGPAVSVREVLDLWNQRRRGVVLIVDNGALVGIFTERDCLRIMARGESLEQPLSKVMRRNPVCVTESDNVCVAVDKMSAGGYRRLPILDGNGQPRGILDTAGVVRFLVEHFPYTVYNLPPEPGVVMQEREGA